MSRSLLELSAKAEVIVKSRLSLGQLYRMAESQGESESAQAFLPDLEL